MKYSTWIISSIGITAIASIFTFQPWSSFESIYTQESLNVLKKQDPNDVQTWLSARFIDKETGLPFSKEKLRQIENTQGWYNTIVSVVPGNSEKILIGGLDIWKWEQITNTPILGGFEKFTQWFLNPVSNKYVHADQHEIQWDWNKLYIGNDGGIGISFDPEGDWWQTNCQQKTYQTIERKTHNSLGFSPSLKIEMDAFRFNTF